MSRLPNFLFIGPDKAGSTWLHEKLIRHPEVFLSPAKDLYFFDRYYDRGMAWYADQFKGARDDHAIVGEVCQDYLFHAEAAGRIAKELGPVKTMVSLRDPVERAWSSWLYARKHGMWPEDFLTAVQTVPELLDHSRYATGLDRFGDHFDRDSILIAVFDDLGADPQAFLDNVTDFLAISRLPLSEEEQQPTLAAAEARSVTVAHAIRRTADVIRERGGAKVIGAVKRNPLVHRVLYRPIDKAAVRPDPAAVDYIRTALADEVSRLDSDWGQDVARRWGWK
ncbi:MAG: sulfotransferase domain-containing protein [Nocardioides sp.]